MESKIKRFEKIKDILKEKMVVSAKRLQNVLACNCDYKQGKNFPIEKLQPFSERDRWGGEKDKHHFFCVEVDCPALSKDFRCELEVLTDKDRLVNPQVMVYDDGRLIWGVDNEHKHVPLENGKVHQIYLYAFDGATALFDEWLSMDLSLRIIRKNTEQLFYDYEYLLQWLDLADSSSQEYYRCLRVLEDASALLDFLTNDEETFVKSVERARELIAQEIYTGQPETKEKVACIGHSHIDVAWLWPMRQAIEKAQHTTGSMLTFMKEYPEFIFFAPQPFLYNAIKREDPELYASIKEEIKRGAWEAEGAMWVEPDCNMPSGESLIRQILIGKRFFKEEFGVDSHIAWLPDSFGFSAALPQILKKSGITTFITSKLSWGDTNLMPNDLFNWKGIDGSEIFSYLITAQAARKTAEFVNYTLYCAEMDVSYVKGTYNRFLNKELYNEALLPYGWGDGGGGPSRPYFESARRIEKANLPMTRLVRKSLSKFVEDMQSAVKDKRLPVWYGELYLERHRGVFVSQAKTKRNNRQCEFLLQNTEFFQTLCESLIGEKYETGNLNEYWKKLLVNQFHDVLPGTSIDTVYQDADEDYLEIRENVGKMQEECLKKLAEKIQGNGLCIFNAWSGESDAVIKMGEEYRLVKGLPSKGYAVKQVEPLNGSVIVTDKRIENEFFIVEFNDLYDIARIFDKRKNREIVKNSRFCNEISAYEDSPHEFDAWEIKDYIYDKKYPVEFISKTVIQQGCCSGFEVVKRVGQSTISQKICLFENQPLIDFDTKIDWRETHILLKTAFPFDLNAYTGRSNIQFGHLQRSLHDNTSWEKARYEVCAHRYFDISEDNYGVAVITDSKYGYGIQNGEINLSLLRASTYPDENADKGVHSFRYAIYVHDGFENSNVERIAYLYNNPPIARSVENPTGDLPSAYSFVKVDKDNVVVDTVKKAESGEGYILRLYESKNRRTNCEITLAVPYTKVALCDLMENEENVLETSNTNTLKLMIKPFEIVTLKVSC